MPLQLALANAVGGVAAKTVAKNLAKAAGVSHTMLQRVFHKTFGTTAGKYITSVKMREAKRLIDENRISLKEVAKRTGFSSPQYFSHAYHEFYGRSPINDRHPGAVT